MRERRVDPVAEEVPEIHLDLGPVTAKRTEVDILALRLGLVGGRPRRSRREVLDRENVVMRLEDLLEQRDQIQPLERRALESTIVQIEPVDVDECAH